MYWRVFCRFFCLKFWDLQLLVSKMLRLSIQRRCSVLSSLIFECVEADGLLAGNRSKGIVPMAPAGEMASAAFLNWLESPSKHVTKVAGDILKPLALKTLEY